MTWLRTFDKPSSEPIMACFTDEYVRHSAMMTWAKHQWLCAYGAGICYNFNASGSEGGIFQDKYFSIMAVDALAPCVAGPGQDIE